MRSRLNVHASMIARLDHRIKSTMALTRVRFCERYRPFVLNTSQAHRIFSISAVVNGNVGLSSTIGAFSSDAGLDSSHFRLTQNLKNERNRSTMGRAVTGSNSHVSLNSATMSGLSNCRKWVKPLSLQNAESLSVIWRYFLTVSSTQFRALASAFHRSIA